MYDVAFYIFGNAGQRDSALENAPASNSSSNIVVPLTATTFFRDPSSKRLHKYIEDVLQSRK